jgi:hypothetical protein
VYWVANWSAPGQSGKAFYRRQPGWTGAVELLLNKGDPVCDGVVTDLRHFRVAPNQTHGQVLDLSTASGHRTALYVDGACPYAVGQPLPQSTESPRYFWHFDLNSADRLLFGAVTNGPEDRNGVMVLDGKVVMREGDRIDGVLISPWNAEPNEVRLDDRGRAVTLWTGPLGTAFTIFYTADVRDFADTRRLVAEGDPLDLDGDGQIDATLDHFRIFSSSGPTFSLGDTGVYIAAMLRYPEEDNSVAAVIFYPF